MNALQWLQVILSYSLQVSLVMSAAWLIEHWTGAAGVKTRIWTACFLSLLGLLAVGLLLPRLHWFHPWSQLGPNELLMVASTEHLLGRSLLAIWVFGSFVMLVRSVVRFVQLRTFIWSCPKLTGKVLSRVRQTVPAPLLCATGRVVEFRFSPEELGPFCYQFHHPVVLLPESLVQGDSRELEQVLRHELTHLKTEHPVQLFAQRLVQSVLWFHPLVWISGRRASLVREFVCDDAATEDGASTASYLRVLLRIVEQRSAKPQSGTMAMGRSASELKIRARRLVSSTTRNAPWFGSLAIAGLLLITVLASQIWLPTNPLAPSTSDYSPWPTWSATTLHVFGLSVRDFDQYDGRLDVHELLEQWQTGDLEDS